MDSKRVGHDLATEDTGIGELTAVQRKSEECFLERRGPAEALALAA